jgi:sugar lactone lactonase YvrE
MAARWQANDCPYQPSKTLLLSAALLPLCPVVASAQAYDFITIAALAGTEGDTDRTNSNVSFELPAGVALDPGGNVHVADTSNQTIRRVSPYGTLATIAGVPGQYRYRDGAGTNALFDLASGIAVDGSGNAYVADTDNNVIRKGWWSATLPAVVLLPSKVNGGKVQLDFRVETGPGGGFTLMSAA